MLPLKEKLPVRTDPVPLGASTRFVSVVVVEITLLLMLIAPTSTLIEFNLVDVRSATCAPLV